MTDTLTDTPAHPFDMFGEAPPEPTTIEQAAMETPPPEPEPQRVDDPPPSAYDLLRDQRDRVARIALGKYRADQISAAITREYHDALAKLDAFESEAEQATPPAPSTPPSAPVTEPTPKKTRKRKTDDQPAASTPSPQAETPAAASPPATPAPEKKPAPLDSTGAKTPQELGLKPGEVECKVSTMILFAARDRAAPVRSVIELNGGTYVVTPTGAPPSADDYDLYMMRPLFASVEGKSTQGEDRFFGRMVEVAGKTWVIGPAAESILVRDSGA